MRQLYSELLILWDCDDRPNAGIHRLPGQQDTLQLQVPSLAQNL
jgi:hypothetical protein